MYTPYVRFANPYTQLDGTAKNIPGSIYSPPPGTYPASSVFSATIGSGTPGFGAPPVFKYVYYQSTLNPVPEIAPAPVYWADETFTIVTGQATEAYVPATEAVSPNGASVAGYLMPNTTQYVGLTAATLNSSYCWIQIGGFLPGAFEPTTQTSTVFANPIYGLGSGAWTSAVNTTIANSTRALGVLWSAISGGVCDVLLGGYPGCFWGS